MTQKAFGALLYLIVGLMLMGWVDWLWLLGVEDSKSYTWWAVMAHFGK